MQLPRLLLLVAGISWRHLFPSRNLLVAGQEGPFLRPRSRCKVGNMPVSHFAQTLLMLGRDCNLGAPVVFLFEVLFSHTSYLAEDIDLLVAHP